jgi:NitT/TauT family transport system substrate-binding protein
MPAYRRDVLKTAAAGAALALPFVRTAQAAEKITFLTSWFAQAEHGGFYQAKATGLYDKAGLDVTIKMGGPQVNGMQLLAGGEADLIMGYDIQVLKAIENNLPVVTVASSFQFDLQGIMTHADVTGLADLKGRKILIASSSHSTFWPWLKQRFGFTDEQAGVYTFNLQPFLVDKTLSVQAYPSSEPFEARAMGADVKFFLFANDGYPPYGSAMVTTRALLQKNPDAVQRFIRASLEGWRDYVKNPAPANAMIKADNPKMTDERIAFAISELLRLKALDSGDAATQGIGVMTEARWNRTYDFMVAGNLLKPTTDWKRGFTTDYVRDLHIMMA